MKNPGYKKMDRPLKLPLPPNYDSCNLVTLLFCQKNPSKIRNPAMDMLRRETGFLDKV